MSECRNALRRSRASREGSTLVAWRSDFHRKSCAADLDRLKTGDRGTRDRFEELRPLGEHLSKEMGEAVYSLAFTAFEGHKGLAFSEPHALLDSTPDSFEDRMARAGHELAFLDLRSTRGKWGSGVITRPISHKELLGIWPRHLDGMVFLRRLEPVRSLEP